MKNKSHNFKVGQAVAYTRVNGDAHSAIVTRVWDDAIDVSWATGRYSRTEEHVPHNRLTSVVSFDNSLFLAL